MKRVQNGDRHRSNSNFECDQADRIVDHAATQRIQFPHRAG